ncbi:MAG: hypothetical protein JWL90_2372 [Chthoniobacteraceae bacterium]|nr:hypothetical protein [Chthoniobacteraceae bacterium]
MNPFPRILRVRQSFPQSAPVDIGTTLDAEFEKLRGRIRPGARIAVGVGSRGITQLARIVAAVIDQLRKAGAQPFIIPAMGSHGGATPEGQREVLASYGVTEESMGVPIHASLEVRQIGESADGIPVFCSTEALAADGVVLVNRIKPHTDFFGTLGSGLLKMSVIGLGKRTGAIAMHQAAMRLGYERVIRGMAAVVLQNAPVLGGVAILENQCQEIARLVVLPRESMETAEDALLLEARSLMPLLPFEEIDLLIVDCIGKNISGAGMDPNVIGRSIHGYSSMLGRDDRPAPFIRRIFVRGLTAETHGNAVGIGMADIITTRLVREMNSRITFLNALTALTPQSAKVPIHCETDREAIGLMLDTLGTASPRIVRIADTLSLVEMELSEALWDEMASRPELTAIGKAHDMSFDADGNLP